MPAWPGRVDEKRGEALDPSVDGDVVDVDAAFGEDFFDVAVGQAGVRRYQRRASKITLGREPVAGKPIGLGSGGTILNSPVRAPCRAPNPSTQRCALEAAASVSFGQQLTGNRPW